MIICNNQYFPRKFAAFERSISRSKSMCSSVDMRDIIIPDVKVVVWCTNLARRDTVIRRAPLRVPDNCFLRCIYLLFYRVESYLLCCDGLSRLAAICALYNVEL